MSEMIEQEVWTVGNADERTDEHHVEDWIPIKCGEKVVATVGHTWWSYHTNYGCVEEGRERRAHLMAAAPELLAAVEALMPEGWDKDDTMDHMPGIKIARAALEKAAGINSRQPEKEKES